MSAALSEQLSIATVAGQSPQATLRDFINAGLIPTSDSEWLETLRKYEAESLKGPQVEFETEHVFHAGTYARTIHMPAGVFFTSVLVKIPTLVIVSGHCLVFTGPAQHVEVNGQRVFAGGVHRKTAYAAYSAVSITMVFATDAKTVAEAEAEFTDDYDQLMSRKLRNTVLTTGD